MRYSREELVMIRDQIAESKELARRRPGAAAYLFLSVAWVILSFYNLQRHGDLWAFMTGFALTYFIYRLVVAVDVVRMHWNLPIKSLDDIGHQPPVLPMMESSTRPAPMVQTQRNQWRRPNLNGLLSKREQSLLYAVMVQDGRVSRPALERAGITGLTDYPNGGSITRLAAIKAELEACGLLDGNDVPEAARRELRGE